MISIDLNKVYGVWSKYLDEIKKQRQKSIDELKLFKNKKLSEVLSLAIKNKEIVEFDIDSTIEDELRHNSNIIKDAFILISTLEKHKVFDSLGKIKEWKKKKYEVINNIVKLKDLTWQLLKYEEIKNFESVELDNLVTDCYNDKHKFEQSKLWLAIKNKGLLNKLESIGNLSIPNIYQIDELKEIDEVITFFEKDENPVLFQKERIDTEKKKEKKEWKYKEDILRCLGYYDLRSSFYPKYFRDLGIKACVYCNSQLAVSVDKDANSKKCSAKFQVDHFYPKDTYPLLSISLLNLYPVCASCNISKKTNIVPFDLYSDDKALLSESLFSFSIDKVSLCNYYVNKDCDKIVINFGVNDNGDESVCNSFKNTFDIEGIYNTQKDLAEELIIKSQMYNESYITTLQSSFDGLKLNPTLFKRTIVGNYTEDKDIHKRPMSKFTMDIARQLGLIDRIK